MEAEKETIVTSLKVKSAVVSEDQTGIQDLKQNINALTTLVKSSTLGGNQAKAEQCWNHPSKDKGQWKKQWEFVQRMGTRNYIS